MANVALMDQYSNEEFIEIILNSYSYKECLQNLGYHSNSGDSTRKLKEKIQKLDIDTSHFTSTIPIVRTEENIFIKNSTASQKVLRSWYEKGKYTEYKCSICDLEPFWNGKELTLILDHINGINNDDRFENLRWVCPNCNQQLDTTNGRNKHRREHNITYCIDCGKAISKKATRCLSCASKARGSDSVDGVTREELKILIRTTPFTKIGEKFGVSDNAVRKWCEKYNLPKRSSDIKNFTDEEWLEI